MRRPNRDEFVVSVITAFVALALGLPAGAQDTAKAGSPSAATPSRALLFDASPDHDAVNRYGEPVVLKYIVELHQVGGNVPAGVFDMGKPKPKNGAIRFDLDDTGVATGDYTARVMVVGPNGITLSAEVGPFHIVGRPSKAKPAAPSGGTTASNANSPPPVVRKVNRKRGFWGRVSDVITGGESEPEPPE
jgi:hypothetical protein